MLRNLIAIFIISLVIPGCELFKSAYATEFGSESATISECDSMDCVWIYHLKGIQCEVTFYENLDSAIEVLKSSGIEILEAKEKSFSTCAACGCPTSLRYLAKINYHDLLRAEDQGWKFLHYE